MSPPVRRRTSGHPRRPYDPPTITTRTAPSEVDRSTTDLRLIPKTVPSNLHSRIGLYSLTARFPQRYFHRRKTFQMRRQTVHSRSKHPFHGAKRARPQQTGTKRASFAVPRRRLRVGNLRLAGILRGYRGGLKGKQSAAREPSSPFRRGEPRSSSGRIRHSYHRIKASHDERTVICLTQRLTPTASADPHESERLLPEKGREDLIDNGNRTCLVESCSAPQPLRSRSSSQSR